MHEVPRQHRRGGPDGSGPERQADGRATDLLDTAISVLEAAVDLVGEYILSDPDLIDQYYELVSQRILDTGVSVRKQGIKILRNICIEYPEQEKILDICANMIRHVTQRGGHPKARVGRVHDDVVHPGKSDAASFLEDQVVPLMDHPSEIFLAVLDLHLMMLIVTQSQAMVLSCM